MLMLTDIGDKYGSDVGRTHTHLPYILYHTFWKV